MQNEPQTMQTWSDVLDFHTHLIESATPYVFECQRLNRPMSVEDYLSWEQVNKDLALEQLNQAQAYYEHL